MPRIHASTIIFPALLAAASLPLIACNGGSSGGDAEGSTTGATASGSSSSTTGTGGSCASGGTIKGTVTFTGTPAPGPNDTLRVAADTNAVPGIPAGYNIYPAPVFPLAYEIDDLPVDAMKGFTNYGVSAYLDYGSRNPMGPGTDDPSFTSSPTMLIKVTACQGGTMDIPLPATP